MTAIPTATASRRPRRLAATPGQIALALAIAAFLLMFLVLLLRPRGLLGERIEKFE